MVNPTVNSRSAQRSEQRSEQRSASPKKSPKQSAERIAGREHPVTAVTRLKHGTKGRAKDAARARGMSLCAFIREAVRDALARHEKSPNAV